MSQEKTTFNLLHILWTKAVGTLEYDKEEWKEFESRLMKLGCKPNEPEPQPVKKDQRIGLSCKPKYRTHAYYYETCHVVDVFPSGTAGIVDPDGVLMIKAVTGRVFLEAADLWVTA